MKHYEVRNEETDTDRPPQTHSFSSQDHGTRALPFSSIAPFLLVPYPEGGSGQRRRNGCSCPGSTRTSQCACAWEVFIILQPRLFWGCLFLGSLQDLGILQVSCISPCRMSCRLGKEERGCGTLASDPRVSCANLAPCRRPGFRKGLCSQPSLARSLYPFLLPGLP